MKARKNDHSKSRKHLLLVDTYSDTLSIRYAFHVYRKSAQHMLRIIVIELPNKTAFGINVS